MYAGELYRSVDSGQTWSTVTVMSGSFFSMYNHIFSCHGNTLTNWGDDGSYRFWQRYSTDGGATWTRVTVYDGSQPSLPIPYGSAWDPVSNTMIVIGSFYGSHPDSAAMNAYYRVSGTTPASGPLPVERIPSNPFDVATRRYMYQPASLLSEY
jgi:hypothetical protein